MNQPTLTSNLVSEIETRRINEAAQSLVFNDPAQISNFGDQAHKTVVAMFEQTIPWSSEKVNQLILSVLILEAWIKHNPNHELLTYAGKRLEALAGAVARLAALARPN